MTHKKLPSILALSISLELILSPLPAMAQTNTQNAVNTAGQLLNLGMGAYDRFRGNQAQPQMPNDMQVDMANFKTQQETTPDKYFTQDNMAKIPGLAEYIAKKNLDASKSGGKMIDYNLLGCRTLPSSLTVADNQVCRDKAVNPLGGDPKLQADEAFAYYNQYSQVQTVYQNFLVRSNSGGQLYGDGCMDDAMTILKGFFAYRVEQMDVMQAEFEAATANFEAGSEMDLKAIRESTALLNGEDSKFAKEFKNTDVLDYAKRFADPACSSIFSKDGKGGAGQIGKSSGLLGIQEKLKNDFSATPAGSKYSPEQYITKNADIIKDIQKMATDVGEQAKLNFSQISSSQGGYSEFLKGVPGSVSSESGANAGLNPSFFADIQTKFAKTRNTLADQSKLISSEMGGKSESAFNLLGNIENDSTFEAEVASLENGIKGDCVNKSGIDTALSRIYDPTLSKQANKQSSELIKKKIDKVISDVTLSPERKLAELKIIQSQSGNRYQMKMDSDYETQSMGADGKLVKKNVSASSRVSPESYFSDIIKNCDSQFQVNKLKNKLSGKEAIQQLRTLKQDFKKAATQHSQDIKNEIIKKMIDCNGNGAVASSSTVGSCSPEKLNMSSPGFCAKAALSCSTNMQKCNEKAEKFVNDIKGDRLKRTNNYNNNVESTRKQMVGMFDTALAKYMKEAESLRGMFGAGFTAPKGIERDIKGDEKFDQKFLSNGSDALEIKDPKKYLDMVKDNIEKLKKQVEDQQKSILSADGPLVKHIAETRKNHKEVEKKSAELAAGCLQAYNSYKDLVKANKEAYDKSQGELGEKKAAFCGRYTDVMSSNPIPGCKDGYSEVTTAMIQAAGKAGDTYAAGEAQRLHKAMSDVCAKPGNQTEKDGKPTGTYVNACLDAGTEGPLKTKLDEYAVENNFNDAKELCVNIKTPGERCTKISTPPVSPNTNPTVSWSCDSHKEFISLIYNRSLGGSLTASADADSAIAATSQASSDTDSFCNASSNAGPYNSKGNMPFGDPMGGAANNNSGVRGY